MEKDIYLRKSYTDFALQKNALDLIEANYDLTSSPPTLTNPPPSNIQHVLIEKRIAVKA